MKIFAIDPGNELSAYVIWDGEKVSAKGIKRNTALIEKITEQCFNVDTVVIEMVQSFGMPVGREVFDTVRWIGKFEQHSIHCLTPVELVTRMQIKMHHCHTSRAKDSNIRQALIDRFGKPGVKAAPNPVFNDATEKMRKDIWSAMAIATCYYDLNPTTATTADIINLGA